MTKIITKEQLLAIKEPVTLVTGSFDILHLGHMHYLDLSKQANPQNLLVVIAISDKDINQRKGKNRPIFSLRERVGAVAHLAAVDFVVGWDQPWQGLRDLVLELKPAMMTVVDGDPGLEDKRKFVESYGGEITSIEKQGDYSSSNIITNLLKSETL